MNYIGIIFYLFGLFYLSLQAYSYLNLLQIRYNLMRNEQREK